MGAMARIGVVVSAALVFALGCGSSKGTATRDGGNGGAAGGGDGAAGTGGGDGAAAGAGGGRSDGGDAGGSDADGGDAPLDGVTGDADGGEEAADGGDAGPSIPGLTALTIDPPSATLTMQLDTSNNFAPAQSTFRALGVVNGSQQDVSGLVVWSGTPGPVSINGGSVTVTAPGVYTIAAEVGGLRATATMTASFTGTFVDTSLGGASRTALDGTPSGTTAEIVYPLDGALFPGNLGAVEVQVSGPAGASAARLELAAPAVDILWYGGCVGGAQHPGTACNLQLPGAITQLLVPASARGDVQLVARVGGPGAPAESAPIALAFSGVALTGGLYFWSAIDGTTVPGYTSPEVTALPSGTGIRRYDFSFGQTSAVPQVVWTDHGASPTFSGSPQSFVGQVAGSHCIGCHAVSGDGQYLALHLGGSAPTDGSNLALLAIGTQRLININPGASTDPNSSPTVDPVDYFKRFRVEQRTETTWGPGHGALVSMYQSRLYLETITIDANAGTGLLARQIALPSWNEYQSDPFWSQDGRYLVFTSFATPDVGTFNTNGLNGDMKRSGQIALATASATAINDDARVVIARQAGVTAYYPALSDDSKLVVFAESVCGADPDPLRSATAYGNQSCDGYDDSAATLSLAQINGQPLGALSRANGAGALTNSRPRFAPSHGTFRGQDLYWIVFSSRRAYGLQINTSSTPAASTTPQLWVAAVLMGGASSSSDPSFAPVWISGQNVNQSAPTDNHTPTWAQIAMPLP
jgi:hypothetical protein